MKLGCDAFGYLDPKGIPYSEGITYSEASELYLGSGKKIKANLYEIKPSDEVHPLGPILVFDTCGYWEYFVDVYVVPPTRKCMKKNMARLHLIELGQRIIIMLAFTCINESHHWISTCGSIHHYLNNIPLTKSGKYYSKDFLYRWLFLSNRLFLEYALQNKLVEYSNSSAEKTFKTQCEIFFQWFCHILDKDHWVTIKELSSHVNVMRNEVQAQCNH